MASNDPEFERKAADIIGLYMNPPRHAALQPGHPTPGPGENWGDASSTEDGNGQMLGHA